MHITAHRATEPEHSGFGASDVICAVRAELDGHTPEAVESILRAQLTDHQVEISDGELHRVAADIATARIAQLLATPLGAKR
ncbi:hypothetical protein [Microterricola viridarii]|uniref:Uncharacterized protein n=1 Tax=Microterricola viridarii TaxID=412690 RepID=A0A1H1W3A2_9MICO|nr:hypothetical protein [Microterricola viridarii]SDS91617.1 hypothetical protein SAMN04489834_2429 [Microterricola viridarii]